jgi:hypothetical protein
MIGRIGHGMILGLVAFVLVGIIENWLNFKIV